MRNALIGGFMRRALHMPTEDANRSPFPVHGLSN